MIQSTIRVAFALGMALAFASCKSQPGSSTTGPSGQPTWQLTIRSTAITNQAGKAVIVRVQQEGQSTVLGELCEPITSSSFTLPGSVMRSVPASPCALADPKRFESGRYTLTTVIVAPPDLQTAEITTTQSVAINDHTTSTIDGGALSRAQPTNTNLTILPATLPALRVGVPVSIALSVAGGTGTGWVFSPNTVGTQIPGLTIVSSGVLSGTPTTAGPYERGVSVVDSGFNSGTIVYSGTVLPAQAGAAVPSRRRQNQPSHQ